MGCKQTSKEIIESGVVHFRVGEDLGLRLMEIAQEHLTEANNPVKALKTITESLSGCPTDLAIRILKGEMVLPVDVESQQVICQDRIAGEHDRFPKIDPCYWIEKRKENIEYHGDNLIQGFKELQKQIRLNDRHVTISLSYDEIFKFVSGTDQDMFEYLRDNYYEVDVIANLFETTKKYIEFSMSIMNTMDWMLKTFNEFAQSKEYVAPNKLFVEYNGMKGDCSAMLTDVMMVMKETLNFEFDMKRIDDVDDNVQKYIDSAMAIDEIVKKGIEPCDIMDNYSAGWLSPDGVYYALNGEIANMLHIQIADALQEQGIVPKKPDDEVGAELNPFEWLETHGWVKIHGNNINFDGCNNFQKGKKNIDITDKQITVIRDYITDCHQCEIKVGWRMERQSIGMFTVMAMQNLPALYKKYFEY
ncbi:MAG: hypothetical protein WC428_02030 [Candidatus Paceibacterota bacterium]